MKKQLFLMLLLLLGFGTTHAQMTCGATFTDPGGPNANYDYNTDYTQTICPSSPGDAVTVTFSSFNTEATWDALYVFNGNSIDSPQIASTNNAGNVPGGLAGGFWGTTIPGPFTSTDPSGCLTFRFRSDNVINNPGWIANVTCFQDVTCPQPTAVTITNITPSGAMVNWTEAGNANAWQVVVVPCGTAGPTINDVGTNITTNAFTVSGLNSFSCYSAYVRAMCNSTETSSWVGPYNFTTATGPASCGGQFVDNGGSNANYLNNSDVTTTICPDNPGDVVTINFASFSTEATWDALYVFDGQSIASPQIMSANNGGNVPGGLPGGFWGTTIPGPFTSSSPDGCLTFRFRSDGSVNNPGWIANVTCAPPPTCPKPTSLSLTNITTTGLTLGWVNPSNATSWEYYIVPTGSPLPTANSVGVTTSVNPVVITNLTSATCYTVYVRALCSETDWSEWSSGVSACTLIAPPECGSQFVDNGGLNANYANSSDNTYTICPNNPGELVTVVFSAFNTEANWDALYVFDGNSINAPQISSTNGPGNVPGGLAGGYWGTTIPGPFTSSSPDGCLTFRFRSDGTINLPGWVANVTCAPDADKIVLVAFVDTNGNGIRDTGESLFPNGNFIYQQNNSGTNISGYSPTGMFAVYDSEPTNTYSFSYQVLPEFQAYYTAAGNTYNNVSIPLGSGPQFLYFPVTLTQPFNDVSIVVTGISAPRPGLSYINKITYRNNGVAATDGTLAFNKPAPVTISNISQTGTTTNAAGFNYNFTNLLPNETRIIYVTMTVPTVPTVNINDLLTASASITAPANDINLANNSSTNSQIVVNSWDPNDKMESHGDKIPINQFTANDYLFYTIRFQNNGTANAIDVRIEDFLDSQLDESSVRMVSASHNYTMTQVDNHLMWEFRNIYLVPSSVNAAASIGYVQFEVKVNPGFQLGDIIPNNASIYFDSNPAIVTNTFTTKFISPLGTIDFDENSLAMYPNPTRDNVQISLADASESLRKIALYDVLGKLVKTVSATSNTMTLDVSDLAKGVYMVEIATASNFKTTKKLIIQ